MRDFGKLGWNAGVTTGQPRVTLKVLLDVVAKAHVLALDGQHGKDGVNLLLVGNGGNGIPWEGCVQIIKKLYPEAVQQGILTPKAGDPDIMADFYTSSTEKTLGFKFAGAEESRRAGLETAEFGETRRQGGAGRATSELR